MVVPLWLRSQTYLAKSSGWVTPWLGWRDWAGIHLLAFDLGRSFV